jgi:uncharacterized protein (DUF1501 family)
MSDSECQSCAEYLQLSRRGFLGAGGGLVLAAAGLPAWLPNVVYAQDACTDRDVVVTVFLRGAADGMTLCVPHTEDAYYNARPTLAVPRPDSSDPNKAINLDGTFGFPPMLAPLIPAYQAGHLLVVHACGSTDPSRSHFDAMRFMEVGKPADPAVSTGWLGRHLATSTPLSPTAVLRAVGIHIGLQRSLNSGPLTLPIPDLDQFGLVGAPSSVGARKQALNDMFSLVGDPVRAAALNSFVTSDLLDQIDFAGYQPAAGAVYPADDFGKSLQSTAALIKADVGVEAVAIDIDGWDTHIHQGLAPGGAIFNLATKLGSGLGAFHADMFSGNGRNLTVVVMSEFGRRLLENGSFGCDHGHGNAMFVMGNNINGGHVLTQWPGLAPQNLFEGRDLEVTIDFRDILAEIVSQRLMNNNLSIIFPDYTPTFRGVTQTCTTLSDPGKHSNKKPVRARV